MELMEKQGYKHTDVGLIPIEWAEPKPLAEVLSEMTDFVAAGSFESLRESVNVYDFDNYAYYVRLVDIRAGIGHFKQKFVDKKSYDFLKRSNLYGGEILIANIGANVGEVFLMPNVDKPATIAPNMILMRTKELLLDSKFCYYFIDSKVGQRLLSELIAGSGHPKLNKTDLKKLLIPLPPTLTEQKTIATALSDVDDLIANLDKLITKKKAIKQGAMQQLLTPPHKGGKRLAGFTGEWVEKKLGEISEIYQPVTISQERFSKDGYPVYGANGIVGNYTSYNHKLWQTAITCRGSTCGTVNRTENECWITGNAMVMNVDNQSFVNKEFFFHLLFNQNFNRCITGSGQPQIVRQPLFDFEVSFPKYLGEQIAIAEILSDMNTEIEQLETKKAKYQDIKQGMMQELLTGKTRLI